MHAKTGATGLFALTAGTVLLLAGCAMHADFVELHDHTAAVSKVQEQDQKRLDALHRRLELLERMKGSDSAKPKLEPRFDELSARIQKVEDRLAELDGASVVPAAPKLEPVPGEPARPAKPQKPASSSDVSSMMPGVPSLTPTSAFNLAYNDYLNGKYDLAVAGFQRFVKDFSGTSLTPNAHYWLGESYYQQKDYVRAMQSFEYLSTEYPGNEKVPAALLKLSLAAGETGDLAKAKKYFKRVIDEFPLSDEAKLAKNKLGEIR